MYNLRNKAPSVNDQPEHSISNYQIPHFSMQQQNTSAPTITAIKNGASHYQQYLEQSVEREMANAFHPSQNVLDSAGRTLNTDLSNHKS